MGSSGEEAIVRLRKWRDTKAPIMAYFVGQGLTLRSTTGCLVLDEIKKSLWLVTGTENEPEILMSLSLDVATPAENFETLLDAPEDMRFSVPFFSAVAFNLPCGKLDLREMATEGR